MNTFTLKGKTRGLFVVLLLLCLFCFSQSAYIQLKGEVAQILLTHAWQQGLLNGITTAENMAQIKPWPWADIYPLASLEIPKLDEQFIVLNNDSGQALAFGPGLSGITQGDTIQGSEGQLRVIAGHRDTHFKGLALLTEGDNIIWQEVSGEKQTFQVQNISIIDTRTETLFFSNESNNSGLILITCYPFDAVVAGTPFRYVIQAY